MIPKFSHDLKKQLRSALKETGLTQSEVARTMNVSRTLVHRIFSLEHNSTLDSMLKVLPTLGLKIKITVKEIT